jgi:hypothetical protein
MQMAVTSQFRRSSCSPLEILDLHTSWAAAFRRPIFLFFVRAAQGTYGIFAEASFAYAPPVGRSKSDDFEVLVAHGLHVDISPDPFLHRGEERWISVDRRTARCRPIDHSLRYGSPGLGICGHDVCLAFLMSEKI